MYKLVEEGATTDEALVQSILHNNREAFRLLIERYEKLVVHIVCRMVKGEQDREDISQEVFLKVYDNLANFRFGSKLSTWIGSIAFNTCINFLKKKKMMLVDMQAPYGKEESGMGDPFFGQYDTGLRPDELLMNKEKNSLLWQYVDELPPIQQTVLSLFHRQEIPMNEIALMMNMPLGTVKSHLHRARQSLKTKLTS